MVQHDHDRGLRLRRVALLAAAACAAGLAVAPAASRAAREVAEPTAREAPEPTANDALPRSLTGSPGDPARGRAIVANRQLGLCLLCHPGPFPEERFQGDLAPDLRGAGRRWTEAQLRLRVVDASLVNPATIMPAYHRTERLARVARAFRGRPILSAEQIEDVVAFLLTLTD